MSRHVTPVIKFSSKGPIVSQVIKRCGQWHFLWISVEHHTTRVVIYFFFIFVISNNKDIIKYEWYSEYFARNIIIIFFFPKTAVFRRRNTQVRWKLHNNNYNKLTATYERIIKNTSSREYRGRFMIIHIMKKKKIIPTTAAQPSATSRRTILF